MSSADGAGGVPVPSDECGVCGLQAGEHGAEIETAHLAPLGTFRGPLPACGHCRELYGTVDADGEPQTCAPAGPDDECFVCGDPEAGNYIELEFTLGGRDGAMVSCAFCDEHAGALAHRALRARRAAGRSEAEADE